MRIQHNISALNTYRQMGTNNTGASKSLEKLSSGYKINRAGDDAAGLAISEKMRAQINGLNRASSNAQDGISLIQAAEGALQETDSILQRMRELAVQAGNDTNETEDRGAIQAELNQLKTEIDRIAYTTEFNKKTLLDGSLKDGLYATKNLAGASLATGTHIDQAIATGLISDGTPVEDVYTIGIKEDAQGIYATNTFSYDLTGAEAGDLITINVDFDNSGRTGGSSISTDVFTYTAVGDPTIDNAAFINNLKEALNKVGAVSNDYEVTSSGNNITFTAKGIGDGYSAVALSTAFTPVDDGAMADEGTDVVTIDGQHATVTITNSAGDEYEIETSDEEGQYVNGVFKSTDTGLVFQINDLTKVGSSIIEVKSGGDLTLQVGANPAYDQTINIGITSISSSGLGIDNLDVSNNTSARGSIASIESAIQQVNSQRSALGAVQNRLEHTTANLDTVAENLQDAESRIRDVDIAKEMMEYSKYNILQQASQAMMAQANSQPQGVLQLLR